MSKIFKRESLQTKGRKLKVDKNRKRNIRLRFNLTDKEKELFERKKEESGARSMSLFI